MKKVVFSVLFLSVLVLLVCTSCNKSVEKVNMKSDVYSEAELNEACKLATDEMQQTDGVTVYKIEYNGDKLSEQVKHDTELLPVDDLDRCIYLTVYYKVAIWQTSGSWCSGSKSLFGFYIGAKKGEDLKVITYGN